MSPIRPPIELPPLPDVLPRFAGLRTAPSRAYNLLQELRQIARRLRRRQPRRFYSTRTVALFFGVDYETTRRAFAELQQEGLLMRLRGSMTLLTPHERGPRVSVRGVVGLPIWLFGHSRIPDWQYYFARLEHHLRRRGFVADIVFYENDTTALLERLLEHDLDAVLWLQPLPEFVPIMQALADHGVQVAAVSSLIRQWPFPSYRTCWDTAVREGLRAWRSEGITSVAGVYFIQNEFGHWAKLIEESGLRVYRGQSFWELPPPLLAQMARTRGLAALAGSELFVGHMREAQRPIFARMLGSVPTLLLNRPPLPATDLAGLAADTALMDWDALAARIARDFARGMLPPPEKPVVFEARLRRHVSGSDLARAVIR